MEVLTAPIDLQAQNVAFEAATAEEIIAWACDHFRGQVCLSTSFQLGGMVLIDMLSRIDKTLPVLFIDTGFHFKETLEFRDQVQARYGINLITLKPVMERPTFIKVYGNDTLYERNPAECCRINKIEPMERALKPFSARIAALRRDCVARACENQDRRRARRRSHADPPAGELDARADQGVPQGTRCPDASASRQGLQNHRLFAGVLHGSRRRKCARARRPLDRRGQELKCGLHMIGMRRPAQDFSI